jgi:hypothetical protein
METLGVLFIIIIVLLLIIFIFAVYQTIKSYNNLKKINHDSIMAQHALYEMKQCDTRECINSIGEKYKDNDILQEAIKHCNCMVYNDCNSK